MTSTAGARRRTRLATIGREMRKYKAGTASLLVLLVYVVVAIGGGHLAPHDPHEMYYQDALTPPSARHLLGTDECGRDLFSLILTSTAVTMLTAIGSVAIGLLAGGTIGIYAAYRGGLADSLLMRVSDILMAFPPIILAMIFVVVLGGRMITVILAIALATTPRMARIARSVTLQEKQRAYVEAAQAAGASRWYVVLRSLLPNCAPTIIVYTTLYAAMNIKIETSLSFLGLGLQPPAVSWGYILRSGYFYILQAPWYVIFPGLSIFLIILCLNLLGDALRDRLDPRLKGVL